MHDFRHLLPPLNALRTFEAAARHASFKLAAEELCVTQAAVSRQIQTLESFYNVPLFLRSNRKVQLTSDGQALYLAATSALQHIATASRGLLQRNSLDNLALTTTTAFAQLWLMPRLKKLHAQYPDLPLNLICSDAGPDYREGFSAAVSVGLIEHPHYVAEYLFAEEVFPVCTPSFLAQHPQIATLQGLHEVPLLNLSPNHWKSSLWEPIDWQFWFKHFGATPPQLKKTLTFSHIAMVFDAALDDVGVALAWRHLVQTQLDSGRLIRPLRETYVGHQRKHYFVCRRDLADTLEMQILRAWILEQTQELRSPAIDRQ